MKITKIKKMSKGKYKVTLDNGTDLVLYEEVVINNIILVGKMIDLELQTKIASDNYQAAPYHQALDYINTRMRSKEEIRTFLLKKGSDENLVSNTIKRLEGEGYIDDLAFAKAYVNDKLHLSYDGPLKIRRALDNLKVSEDIIDEALSLIDDDMIGEKVEKLIAKQMKLKTKYVGNILKNKIATYLFNLGYDNTIIFSKLNAESLENNSNVKKEYEKLYKKYSKKYSGYQLDMVIKKHLYQKGYDSSEFENITN